MAVLVPAPADVPVSIVRRAAFGVLIRQGSGGGPADREIQATRQASQRPRAHGNTATLHYDETAPLPQCQKPVG